MRLFVYPYLVVTFASLTLTDTLEAGSIVVGHRVSAAGRQREILRNERLFGGMATARLRDAARFDRAHPFYGQLLGNSASYSYYMWRWQLAPARFEHYHPLAWRILDGRASLEAKLGAIPVETVPETPTLPPLPPRPPTPPTPPTPPVDPHPGLTPQGAVPEPSTALMMIVGAGTLLLARAGGWVGRR